MRQLASPHHRTGSPSVQSSRTPEPVGAAVSRRTLPSRTDRTRIRLSSPLTGLPSTLNHAADSSTTQSDISHSFRALANAKRYNGGPSINDCSPTAPRPANREAGPGPNRTSINHPRNFLSNTLDRPQSSEHAQSFKGKDSNITGQKATPVARRNDSDSEDILQAFRLPEAKTIKFKADIGGSKQFRSSPEPAPQPKPAQHTKHRKKQSYDESDVKRVKTIFSSAPRLPSSFDANPSTSQLQTGDFRHRQSQRESKAPERLVTETSQPVRLQLPKPNKFPSGPASPITAPRHRKQSTPPRSQISVVIPTSQHESKQDAFNFEEDQNKKNRLLREMKHNVAIAHRRAESVERYFGTTGFSNIYATASDEERVKNIHKLQPRAKKVRRKDIKLDWGAAQPTTPFRAQDIIRPRDQIKNISKSTVLSTSGPPLTFVNDVDDRSLNGKFQFINEYVIREGVKYQPGYQNAHVNCSDTCTGTCSPSTCSCFRNTKTDRFGANYIPTYSHRPDGTIVLSDSFMSVGTDVIRHEIMECNNNCRCDRGCCNRLVQRGRTLPLEIFMTESYGFGLRCPKNIVRGQFVELYLGEVVTELGLEKRENAQQEGEPSYVFSLDWFKKLGNLYHIDSANFGTSMRYINHSCNANCAVFPVMLKEYDQNIYGLAVFAVKDISAMVELTLDYAPAPTLEEDDEFDVDRVRCLCGEENCRGWLWPKSMKRARRRKMVRG